MESTPPANLVGPFICLVLPAVWTLWMEKELTAGG
jgi:hypothetical protein